MPRKAEMNAFSAAPPLHNRIGVCYLDGRVEPTTVAPSKPRGGKPGLDRVGAGTGYLTQQHVTETC